ncbi:hypothetical protein K432DRAFT_384533 [Lepidopterella palustris CBS 459.81]|uniref:Uncharacterized protein n=1 Tax=Lepidopterella palustris CBS 459.81 TaxID=1314670 RepID=A0A8E2JCM8_9PEZI|nr:hypothetical protein K432DRAFT_384533 [Lepidopterella palustris CBS 459.81]
MDIPYLLRQLLRAPSSSLNLLTSPVRPRSRNLFILLSGTTKGTFSTAPRRLISTNSLPRVAQPSLWASLVPKFLRRSPDSPKKSKSKEWNPATPYIILSLLVGSQAIQAIGLRNSTLTFTRRADAKIGLLKEVIEKVQRGEDVDVERVLGTGDPEKEREWEDVLKEIEEEEALYQSRKRRKAMKEAEAREEEAEEKAKQDAESRPKVQMHGKARFY